LSRLEVEAITPLLNTSTAQRSLRVGLCLGQANDLTAFFPLAALFKQLDAFEAFQDITLGDDGAGSSKTAMLRHKLEMNAQASAKLAIFKCQLREDYNWFVNTTCCPEEVTW